MTNNEDAATLATRTPTEGSAVPSVSLDPQLFEVWKKYEDIAVHFNDLIMRWRLQAMGGMATLVTLGGFVASDATTRTVGFRAVFILSGMLTCAWMGVGFIDLFYYRKLLKVAVAGILKLENNNPSIDLSTRIEDEAKWGGTFAPWVFYLLGLAPLIAILVWSGMQLCDSLY